jgi:hypothetical protein
LDFVCWPSSPCARPYRCHAVVMRVERFLLPGYSSRRVVLLFTSRGQWSYETVRHQSSPSQSPRFPISHAIRTCYSRPHSRQTPANTVANDCTESDCTRSRAGLPASSCAKRSPGCSFRTRFTFLRGLGCDVYEMEGASRTWTPTSGHSCDMGCHTTTEPLTQGANAIISPG